VRVFSSSIGDLLLDGTHQVVDIVAHTDGGATQTYPLWRQELLKHPSVHTGQSTSSDAPHRADVSLQLLCRVVWLSSRLTGA
jgi:hypothetical protein